MQVQPEIVLHLAAQPIVRDSYKDPVYTYETTILGTHLISHHCLQQFIYYVFQDTSCKGSLYHVIIGSQINLFANRTFMVVALLCLLIHQHLKKYHHSSVTSNTISNLCFGLFFYKRCFLRQYNTRCHKAGKKSCIYVYSSFSSHDIFHIASLETPIGKISILRDFTHIRHMVNQGSK